MRIHRLQLTAFGPFPGTEVVDLDALSTGGLFLLHGPTGAGKTSVLDAVCFALYGRVPGPRAGGGRLRSDHADPSVPPEVVCEFSVGGRRFEVTRSPAWERPKKRGTGTTTEQTRVAVRERDGDDWRVLTTRADEAGHLLDELLGLGLDQFTKLVLLPQGEFAAFLRADAEVRRQMLERLFGTDRFAAVQQWMRQHQLELRREADAAATQTQVLLAQARQAVAPLALGEVVAAAVRADLSSPDEPGESEQGGSEQGGSEPGGSEPDPSAQLALLRRAARQSWEDATTARLASQATLEHALDARQQGELLAARRQEQAEVERRRQALVAGAADQEQRRRRIEQAVRAAGLVPVAAAFDGATRRAEQAVTRLGDALATARRCSPLDADGTTSAIADPARTEAAAQQARQSLAALVDAERDATRMAELDAELARHRVAVEVAGESASRARQAITDLEGRLTAGRERRRAAGELAAREGDVRAALAAAQLVVTAVARRETLLTALQRAEPARAAARQARDDARETWLDLRERRLAGIAAELAAQLSPGAPCPVCGSDEHPVPAAAGPGTEPVDQAAERAAQTRVEAADRTLEAAGTTLADLHQQLAAVAEQAGDLDAGAAAEAREAAAAELDGVLTALTELSRTESLLSSLGDELAAALDRRDAAEAALRTASADLAAVGNLAGELRDRVAAAQQGASGLAQRRRSLQAWLTALDAVTTAQQEAAAAQAVLDDALAAADVAASEAGFATVGEALAAVADPAALAHLRADVRRYDDELAAVEDRAGDPALVAAAVRPAPVLPALRAAEEHARSDDDAAAARAAVCETAVVALDGIDGRLRTHLARCTPVLERYRTAEQLSRCLDGTGGDNTRRMSLSAYVLAARLEQVALAATERLQAMSGGRYSLVHSDDLERGRVRSGLALKVVDEWTGAERETSSLSGGEAFYTSLALALGLADVVTAESAGAAVETLFVDEGFGSLDEETLDEVMDVLDGLRSGGRAVGLVSHVPDLRNRIAARLEVVKTRAGSRLLPAVGT